MDRSTVRYCALFLFVSLPVSADSEPGTRYEQGTGFTLETADGEASLTIGGRIQFRETYTDFDRDRGMGDNFLGRLSILIGTKRWTACQ